jgi:hypothetical protein
LVAPARSDDPEFSNFAGLAEPWGGGPDESDVLGTDDDTDAVYLEGMRADVAERWLAQIGGYRGTVKYENLWFCWHALARVRRNWRRYAWWSADYASPVTEEQAAALLRREAVQREMGDFYYEKFGELEVGPGAWFPPPTAEGACPPKFRRRELELLMLLGHYIRVPVRPKLDRPINTPDDPAVSVGSHILAYLDLEAPAAELEEQIAEIRRVRGIVPVSHARTWRVWGGEKVSAVRVIAFLDHLVAGGSIQSFADAWVAEHGGERGNARKSFAERGADIHHVFHREPLASLRGTSNLPSRVARRRRSTKA